MNKRYILTRKEGKSSISVEREFNNHQGQTYSLQM